MLLGAGFYNFILFAEMYYKLSQNIYDDIHGWTKFVELIWSLRSTPLLTRCYIPLMTTNVGQESLPHTVGHGIM